MPRKPTPVGAPKSLEAAEDRRSRLIALRDRLEAAIAEAGHRDLAPLAARYQSVLSDLAALPVTEGSDGIDDLSTARARRRAAASGS